MISAGIFQPSPSLLAEARSKHRYPYAMEHHCCGMDFRIDYRRSPPIRQDKDECVAHRNLWAWVLRDDERIGGLHIVEWCIDGWAQEEHLLADMEAHEPEVYDFAAALCSVWDIGSLMTLGTSVELRAAWMTAGEHPDLLLNCASVLIDRFYGHRSSVALLKKANIANQATSCCKPRESSAFCYPVLHLTPLPGVAGQEGWMWQKLNARVPEPRNWA